MYSDLPAIRDVIVVSGTRYFPPAGAKVYIVSFRTHDDRRPSKFIVIADSRKEAINIAWEHGGPDFHARFDKSTGQAQEMKAGALRVRDWCKREASRCQCP
jgi:hypothetical protein